MSGYRAAAATGGWEVDPLMGFALLLCLGLYLAGVLQAWRAAGSGRGIAVGRAVAGVLGFVALALALLSPLERLATLLFSAHMAQHLLLVLVAAPLLVIGVPLLALLWLAPPHWRTRTVRAWRGCTPLRRSWWVVSAPIFAWFLFVALLWAWHLPAAYQGALAHDWLHALEHGGLLAAAGLFWWSILQPLGRRRLSRFGAPLVLFVTAVQGGLLGAMITLAPRPWYEHYERVAETLALPALADQQLAGLLMWVPPGALYLGLAVWLLYRGLVGLDTAPRPLGERVQGSATSRLNLLFGLIALGSVLGLAEAQVLRPVGPAAAAISTLWWLMLALATLVCLVVFTLLLIAVCRGRDPSGGGPPLGNGVFVVLGGIVVPILILVPLLLYSLGLTASLVTPARESLTVEVTGHQWWWEVRYPEAGVVDANQIHVPAGRPVQLRLTSADVIHSFWAPGIQGKMDLVPGSENHLWIEVDDVGVHEAKCAEFCGAQHANMRLLVVAEPEERFDDWLSRQADEPPPPREPLEREGQRVFLESPCVGCHNIEGTPANGTVGPDLTHIASRMTLGAGTVANNHGNLGGWIANSQALKPGNKMPPMYLPSDDLHALLAYLESLE